MHIAALIAGCLIIGTMLWDAFETIALPRTAMRRMRFARGFYRVTWRPWVTVARRLRSASNRENFLALYGPLSIFVLLTVWALGLVMGFALRLLHVAQIRRSPSPDTRRSISRRSSALR
jgi:hypothetical protein